MIKKHCAMQVSRKLALYSGFRCKVCVQRGWVIGYWGRGVLPAVQVVGQRTPTATSSPGGILFIEVGLVVEKVERRVVNQVALSRNHVRIVAFGSLTDKCWNGNSRSRDILCSKLWPAAVIVGGGLGSDLVLGGVFANGRVRNACR